jgi:hypothetical protein
MPRRGRRSPKSEARRHIPSLQRRLDFLRTQNNARERDATYQGNLDPARREEKALEWAIELVREAREGCKSPTKVGPNLATRIERLADELHELALAPTGQGARAAWSKEGEVLFKLQQEARGIVTMLSAENDDTAE